MKTVARAGSDLQGLAVLVVEDEALVAMLLEEILENLGCTVLGPAMRFERAHALANETLNADVAILDVNLGGEEVFPIAEILHARGVPLVFATGYGRSGMPEKWQNCCVIQKPYTAQEVESSIRLALGRR